MNTHERFVKKVNKTDCCWNWTGSKSGSGYGQFWNGAKTIPAHWFLLDEHPKNGKEACHHCDNRLCVRPSHIFIGTRSDNMKDMVKKRRHNTSPGAFAMLKVRRICNGETNHQSVLSDSDAATIKAIGAGYGRGVAVAKKFGVSQTVVSGIWKAQRWSHVQPDATARQRAEAFLKTLGKWEEVQGQ